VKAWRSLNPQQKRSGLAGWLGWMFDGLDLHLYTLVATPFVAALLMVHTSDPDVATKGSIIQAAFLAGWALGGAFFGIFGDKLGRSRTLVLTILCYSVFCGLSAFAQNWWQLMICRFLSALGIGGEWAVGAALISETFPKNWRPWLAGILQTGVNVGILIACAVGVIWGTLGIDERWIFTVGAAPALITLWIRRSVPEPEEWHAAQRQNSGPRPGIRDLFAPALRSTTWRVLLICAFGLSAHWAFMFWQQLYIRNHAEIKILDKGAQSTVVAWVLALIVGSSIAGNFISSWLAVRWGYAKALLSMSLLYGAAMAACFSYNKWSFAAVLGWFALIGMCQGLFGLFTMCLPPMFPTLLRTTGAGFCYNIGRLAAAGGTVFFGIFNKPGNTGGALFYASLLFVPTALLCLWLPRSREEEAAPELSAA
jgi:MFS family permease